MLKLRLALCLPFCLAHDLALLEALALQLLDRAHALLPRLLQGLEAQQEQGQQQELGLLQGLEAQQDQGQQRELGILAQPELAAPRALSSKRSARFRHAGTYRGAAATWRSRG